MYRILVVEDNPVICRGIAASIDENRGQLEICGMAIDGCDAQEKVERLTPDIVVTDIRMPRRSGLELAEWLHETHPKIQIIMISSYDDFSYARRALQFGCIDYLLKPTDPKELNAAVQKAITALEKARASGISGASQTASILAACLRGDLQNAHLLPATLRCGILLPIAATLGDKKRNRRGFDALSDNAFTHVPGENYDCFLLSLQDAKDARAAAETFYRKLQSVLPGQTICLGAGIAASEISELQQAYRQAQDALLYGLLLEPPPGSYLIRAEQLPSVRFPQFLPEADMEFRLHFAAGDPKRMLQLLHERLSIALKQSPTFPVLRTVIVHFSTILSDASMAPLSETEAMNFSARQWYAGRGSIEGVLSVFYALAAQKCQETQKSAGFVRMEDVLNNMKQNYAAELTLESISEVFHLSPNYLATQFKKFTGRTVNQQITSIRIERAKQLLTDSTLSMHQIAHAVGYQSGEYFFRVFKKVTHLTPGEWREQTNPGKLS